MRQIKAGVNTSIEEAASKKFGLTATTINTFNPLQPKINSLKKQKNLYKVLNLPYKLLWPYGRRCALLDTIGCIRLTVQS